MLLRQCYVHADKFWTIARRWPTGNQRAAVFDVRTSGFCVGSMCPVPVVRIPGVEHFITLEDADRIDKRGHLWLHFPPAQKAAQAGG